MATYLCVFHLATAGLNGPLLGTDEEEVVLICFAVLNAVTNQVFFFYFNTFFLFKIYSKLLSLLLFKKFGFSAVFFFAAR